MSKVSYLFITRYILHLQDSLLKIQLTNRSNQSSPPTTYLLILLFIFVPTKKIYESTRKYETVLQSKMGAKTAMHQIKTAARQLPTSIHPEIDNKLWLFVPADRSSSIKSDSQFLFAGKHKRL